jgi:hypothetical protein
MPLWLAIVQCAVSVEASSSTVASSGTADGHHSDVKPGAPAGAINGGFFPKKPDWPAQYPSIVIGVDDIESAMRRVGKEGGKVLGEPLQIPGVGRYVSFLDTEGNRVSMLQPGRA